jgi:hypothetical protein
MKILEMFIIITIKGNNWIIIFLYFLIPPSLCHLIHTAVDQLMIFDNKFNIN